jgi:hypothetical protein
VIELWIIADALVPKALAVRESELLRYEMHTMSIHAGALLRRSRGGFSVINKP